MKYMPSVQRQIISPYKCCRFTICGNDRNKSELCSWRRTTAL